MRNLERARRRAGFFTRLAYPALLSLCTTSHSATAKPYWQLQHSGVTVVAESDAETAKNVAAIVLRIQSAARWLLMWPESYREPPVLVFVVNEHTLRRVFEFPPEPIGADKDLSTRHGFGVRTPVLTVVAVPQGYQRGRELRGLQHAYGSTLLQGEYSHDWPACAHIGMAELLAAAELKPPNHFFLSADLVRSHPVWNPEQFLLPVRGLLPPMPQYSADEWGYSCYLLGFMIASVSPEQRLALERMLVAVGKGAPLEIALESELRQTLPEFTADYRQFARSLRHNVLVDFPEQIPEMPDPVAITAEAAQSLLVNLCNKLGNCRK